jgi:hypothetical protein
VAKKVNSAHGSKCRVFCSDSDLSEKDFAYDGEKSLCTVRSLPRNKLEFTVVFEDVQSNRYTIRVCDSFMHYGVRNQRTPKKP